MVGGGGTQPSGSHNGLGILNVHTHIGNYYTQLALDTNQNYLWIRSANNVSTYGSWARLAMASEIPSSMAWSSITSKPDTATRWPSWSEVTGKPSSFTPATHYHDDRYLVRIFPEVSSGNTFNLAAQHGNMKLIGLRNGYSQYYTGANSVGIDNRSVILHFAGYDGSSGHWTQLYLNTGTLKFRSEDHLDWYDIVHSGNIGSQSVNYASSAGSVAWSNVSGKPDTFTPSDHTHNYLPLSGGNLTGPVSLVASGNDIASFQSVASIGVVSFKGNGSYGTRLDVKNLDNTETVICLDYTGYITANKFIKSGGTSSQFLKADGSVDSNSYSTTSHTHSYLPLSGGTMTGNITGSNGGGSWGYATTLRASIYKPTPTDSSSYFPVIGGTSKNGAWSYGFIGTTDYSYFSWNKSDESNNVSIALRNTSGTIALTSDIPSTYAWSSITSKPDTATRWPAWSEVTDKPDTATRWPSWSEVTDKPSTFSPSSHTHDYIVPTRHDTDAPTPKTKGQSLTFQFSYFDSDWWNVLNMRSYGDYNYLSSQILTPAGNPGSDTGYGDMYWREGRQSTWIAKRKVLDDVNSGVSGGGDSLGSSLTVKIGGTEKTLTIPSTVAWSSLTSVPSSFSPSSHTHTHIKGESGQLTKQAGDFTVYYTSHIAASTSGTPATSDNSNGILTVNRHEGNYYSQIGFGSDGRIKYRSYSGQAIADNVTKSWNTLAYTSEIPTTMSWSNITGKPSTFTPSDHTHSYLPLNGGTITGTAASLLTIKSSNNDNYITFKQGDTVKGYIGWENGTGMFVQCGSRYIHVTDSGSLKFYDTSDKDILHSGNYTDYTVKKDGTGASGTWGISISGTAAVASSVAWGNVTGKPSSYTPASHTHSFIYERADARSDNPTPEEAVQRGGYRGFYMDFVNAGGPSGQGTYSAGFFINPWNSSGSDWSGGGIHEVRFNQNGKIYHRIGNGSGWGNWETLVTTTDTLNNTEIDNIMV